MAMDKEREELAKMLEEIHTALNRAEKNRKDLPFNAETAEMQLTMANLLTELQRAEKNIRTALGTEEENGGKDNGND